jgi:hypothetical protein
MNAAPRSALLMIAAFLGLATAGTAAASLQVVVTRDDPARSSTVSRLRLVNLAPGSPPLDLWVNGGLVATNVAFGSSTPFVATSARYPNAYKVVPTGATAPVVGEGQLWGSSPTDQTVTAQGI